MILARVTLSTLGSPHTPHKRDHTGVVVVVTQFGQKGSSGTGLLNYFIIGGRYVVKSNVKWGIRMYSVQNWIVE